MTKTTVSDRPIFLKADLGAAAAKWRFVLLSRHRRRLLCLDLDAGAAKVRKEPKL
jgi:hypothetical protein